MQYTLDTTITGLNQAVRSNCVALLLLLRNSVALLLRKRSHELADDAQHDLVGPSSYGPQPQVPVQPRDVDVVRESHTAPKLEAGIGNFP